MLVDAGLVKPRFEDGSDGDQKRRASFARGCSDDAGVQPAAGAGPRSMYGKATSPTLLCEERAFEIRLIASGRSFFPKPNKHMEQTHRATDGQDMQSSECSPWVHTFVRPSPDHVQHTTPYGHSDVCLMPFLLELFRLQFSSHHSRHSSGQSRMHN